MSLRFAVVGQHARSVLTSIRDVFESQVHGQSWAPEAGGRDTIDVGLDLQVASRTVSLAIHALPVPALYERVADWPLYGGLIVAAGPEDAPGLDAMVRDFEARGLPVWSARLGVPATTVDRGGPIEVSGETSRAAMRAMTRTALERLRIAMQP